MKVMLKGVKDVDFSSSDGRVTGTKLYFSYPMDGVDGEVCESKFVKNPKLLKIDPHEFLGTEIHIEMGPKGQVMSVEE